MAINKINARGRDYNPTTMPEYRAGADAFWTGKERRHCPYVSGRGKWNRKRHAWMLGFLEAEFEKKYGVGKTCIGERSDL